MRVLANVCSACMACQASRPTSRPGSVVRKGLRLSETVSGPETKWSGDHELKCRVSATSLCRALEKAEQGGWVGFK